jgi:hypothetical protein
MIPRFRLIAPAAAMIALLVLASAPKPAAALSCSIENPDRCGTCNALRGAYAGQDVSATKVVRGRSVWTPLYAAYFRDCPDLAQAYISDGAHPAVGGMEGDLLATVISWDRWEVNKRAAWVRMLVRAGAKLDQPKITGQTTRERLRDRYGPREDIVTLIEFAEREGG